MTSQTFLYSNPNPDDGFKQWERVNHNHAVIDISTVTILNAPLIDYKQQNILKKLLKSSDFNKLFGCWKSRLLWHIGTSNLMPLWQITFVSPRPQRPKGYCRHLILSVRPSVEICCPHDNSSFFFQHRITRFAPNVYLMTIQNPIENCVHLHWFSRKFWVLNRSKSAWNRLVRTITRCALKRGSPNLQQMCISWPPSSVRP